MSVAEKYDITVHTMQGPQMLTLEFDHRDVVLKGKAHTLFGPIEMEDTTITGNNLTWTLKVTSPMAMSIDCEAEVDGDCISGWATMGGWMRSPFEGHRV